MDSYIQEMTDKMSDEDKEYYGDYDGKMQAENDADTMMRYADIKADKDRMKKALHCANKKIEELKRVTKGETDE